MIDMQLKYEKYNEKRIKLEREFGTTYMQKIDDNLYDKDILVSGLRTYNGYMHLWINYQAYSFIFFLSYYKNKVILEEISTKFTASNKNEDPERIRTLQYVTSALMNALTKE